MKTTPASQISFGGVMAALALVIMNLVGLIPIATYVCPALCMIILSIVLKRCGRRIAWAWYGAVAILSLLLAPDREAAAIFVVLGYYPILKPALDRLRFGKLLKLALFNSVILLMYWLLIRLFGMEQLAKEYLEMGILLTVVTLILGNMIFFMLDRILSRVPAKK
jgi:hypothetical protein